MSDSQKEKKNNNPIRKEIAERVAWCAYNKDQLELGLMIEDHHRRVLPLAFEERELICAVWSDLEKERLATKEEVTNPFIKTKKTVTKKKKKSGITEEDE